MKKHLFLLFFLNAIPFLSHAQFGINAIDIGSFDYVEVANNADGSLDINNGFTVEAWILTGNAQSNQKVVGKIGGDFINGFILGIQDGQVNFEVFDNTNTQTVLQVGTVPDTTWTHIAGSYEVGGMLTIFVNGVSAGQVAASAGVHNPNSSPFRVGIAPWDTNALGFFGFIDEVRYWNTVLGEATVRDWMHKDIGSEHPDFSNLGLYHKYDEGVDATTGDLSGNNNNGVLEGAGWIPSTVPFKGVFDLYENDVRGVWPGQTQASSDIMTLFGSVLEADQSIVFAHSSDGIDFTTNVAPPYSKRLSRIWRVTTQGMIFPSFETQFDLSSVDLTAVTGYALLASTSPDFSTISAEIPGTLDGTTLNILQETYFDEVYYTIGLIEEGMSVDELYASERDFRIDPNPNGGQFQMTLENEEATILALKIIDLTGKELLQKSINPGQGTYTESFDLSSYPKGVYLLQLTDASRSSTRKIVLD